MVIEIQQPEVESLVLERMKSGAFRSIEDVIFQALKSSQTGAEGQSVATERAPGRKSLAVLFAESPFRGLELEFERNPDSGRDIAL